MKIYLTILILASTVLCTGTVRFAESPEFLPYADAAGMVNFHPSFRHLPQSNESEIERIITPFWGWPLIFDTYGQEGGLFFNVDPDPEMEVIYNIGFQVTIHNIDGSPVPGWPQTLTRPGNGQPAIGDIDGDGIAELVVSTRTPGTGNEGDLYAFEFDGTPVAGFPVVLNGGGTRTPCLADLDGDQDLEIIVTERDYPQGFICVYQGDGSVMPGWPQQLDYIPGSAAAAGDVDGDGDIEIFAESYYSLNAFDHNGSPLLGFPFSPGADRVFSYSTPVLADLDDDGDREIIFGDHSTSSGDGRIWAIHHNGATVTGWPQSTSYWVYGPPAVGDIDGDGSLDVAVGDQVMAGTPVCQLYAWDASGNPLAGFPYGPTEAINIQIILADMDGDGQIELVYDDNTGNNQYHCVNHDGTYTGGDWPLTLTGMSFYNMPCVGDVNGDGNLDMTGAGYLGEQGCNVYLWGVNVPFDPELALLPVLQYNPAHNGVQGLMEPPPPPPHRPGDVDDNGVVTPDDAVFTLEFTAGLDPLPDIDPLPWEPWRVQMADTDADMQVVPLDAGHILRYTSGITDTLPLFDPEYTPPQATVDISVIENAFRFEATGDLVGFWLGITDPNTMFVLDQPVVHGDYISAMNQEQLLISLMHDEPAEGLFLEIPFTIQDVGMPTIEFQMVINDQPDTWQYTWTEVESDIPPVTGNRLIGVAPNPFNPETTLRYTACAEHTPVKLEIFNIRGQLVRSIDAGSQSRGTHSLVWDGRNDEGVVLTSGIYPFRLHIGASVHTGRLVLMK